MKQLCPVCNKRRDLKFFRSKRKDSKCTDCRHKKIRLEQRNSPKRVNKLKDDEWAIKVKEQANFKCEYCGKIDTLNSHHIFSRSNHSVRWDLDNGVCLCVAHHTFSKGFSAHKTPVEFVEWIKEVRGEEWYDNLRRKARSVYKTKTPNY